MPNRVKAAKLAKEGDAAEQALLETRRAVADAEDSAARARARSQRKNSNLAGKYMPKGNG